MMFTPAQNFRAVDSDCPSPLASASMPKRAAVSTLEAPAMKRQSTDASSEVVKEFVVHSFDELDMTKLSVKQRITEKKEKPSFNTSYDHARLLINLAPKKMWQYIPYAIEDSKYAKQEGGEHRNGQSASGP